MMHPETRQQATRLFAALDYGEQLAHDRARQQLRRIDSPGEYSTDLLDNLPDWIRGRCT